jgi:hypothetical protein
MGCEFDSTDFPNINVHRLDLCNVWFYFTLFEFNDAFIGKYIDLSKIIVVHIF